MAREPESAMRTASSALWHYVVRDPLVSGLARGWVVFVYVAFAWIAIPALVLRIHEKVTKGKWGWSVAVGVLLSIVATVFTWGLAIYLVQGTIEDPAKHPYLRQVFASAQQIAQGERWGPYDERGIRTRNTWRTYVPFQDGALCARHVRASHSGIVLARGHPVRTYSASDSRVPVTLRYGRESRGVDDITKWTSVCTELVPGSRRGPLAAWRRTGGRVLLRVAAIDVLDLPVGDFVATAILATMAAIVLAVTAAIAFTVAAFGRAVLVLSRALRAHTTTAWQYPGSITGGTAVLTLLSDLHIGEQLPIEFRSGAARLDNDAAPDLAARATAALQSARAREAPVLVLGDITDTGSEADWNRAKAVLHGPPTYTIPGNHDVSINERTRPDRSLAQRREREERYQVAMQALNPAQSALPQSFDLGAVRLILLDSNRYASRYLLSNAVGAIGRRQLLEFESLLALDTKPTIVALHHHVARRGDPAAGFRARLLDLFCIVQDGKALLHRCQQYARRTGHPVLLLHGHQHQTYRESFGSVESGIVLVYGHPSTTLGEKGTAHSLDGVVRIGVVTWNGSDWRVDQCRVPPETEEVTVRPIE